MRKFVLSAHITFSVGWLGAVAGFIVLNIAGLINKDDQMVRSAYIAMDLIGWYVILPSSLGSLLTGLIQSLTTSWGLFKHFWILVKFILTLGATILLLLHMQSISHLAELATRTPLPNAELREQGSELLVKAVAALVVLLATTVISVYKPWGKTRYRLSKQQEVLKAEANLESVKRKPWGRYILIGFICLVLLFILMHLLGGGLGRH